MAQLCIFKEVYFSFDYFAVLIFILNNFRTLFFLFSQATFHDEKKKLNCIEANLLEFKVLHINSANARGTQNEA